MHTCFEIVCTQPQPPFRRGACVPQPRASSGCGRRLVTAHAIKSTRNPGAILFPGHFFSMVETMGIEPTTSGLQSPRSPSVLQLRTRGRGGTAPLNSRPSGDHAGATIRSVVVNDACSNFRPPVISRRSDQLSYGPTHYAAAISESTTFLKNISAGMVSPGAGSRRGAVDTIFFTCKASGRYHIPTQR